MRTTTYACDSPDCPNTAFPSESVDWWMLKIVFPKSHANAAARGFPGFLSDDELQFCSLGCLIMASGVMVDRYSA